MKSYPLLSSQRWSRISLAVICILFVVTAPVGIWLMVLAFRRVDLSADEIAIRPLGKTMKISDVKRFGYGVLKDLVPGNKGLNTNPAPRHISSIIYVLEDGNNKAMRIPLSNYDPALGEALITALGRSPQKMVRKGLWGLEFKSD